MHAHYHWLQKKKSSWHFVPLRALCIAHMCITPLEEATAGRPRMFFSRRHVKWTATESESTPTFSLFFFSLHHFIGRLLCAIRLGFLNRPPAAQLLRTLKLSLLPPTNIKINLSFFFFDPDEQSRTNKKFEVLVTATRTKASEHYKKVE